MLISATVVSALSFAAPAAPAKFDAEAPLRSQPELFQPATTIPFQDEQGFEGFSYTFVEVGYVTTDIDVIDESADTVYGRASLGLFDFLYVFLDYQVASLDDIDFGGSSGDVDSDQFGLGVGAHIDLSPRLDLVGEAAWLSNDLESDDIANLDDSNDGWTAFAGARWMALPWDRGGLELNGGFRWIDQKGLLSDEETAAWEAGARLHFLKFMSVGLNYAFLEDDSAYAINARFSF